MKQTSHAVETMKIHRLYVRAANRVGLCGNEGFKAIGLAVARAMGKVCSKNKTKRLQMIAEFMADTSIPMIPAEEAKPIFVGAPQHPVDVTSKEFLSTYAWRKLRMEVLKEQGARCQCCGATPEHGVMMHVDHIKPRRLYPELALVKSNLQVLCEDCNHGKGNWDETDWRLKEESLPDEFYRPMWGKQPS